MAETRVLTAKMMGDFALIWNDKNIVSGFKSIDSHFIRLMEMLIHAGDEGVLRRDLEELLFDASTSEDIHHLLHSVMYNTRRKLSSEGFPDVEYIEFRASRYYWTQKIPVEEDAKIFEELCMHALEIDDPDMRLDSLLEACYYYGGEFLPNQSTLVWVAEENRRYSRLFRQCVEEASELLRLRGAYDEMIRLGRHACRTSPLNEWELLVIDALTSLGRFKEAHELYEQAADYYQKELGAPAIGEFLESLEGYAARITNTNSVLTDIQNNLLSGDREKRGGLLCTYPVFRGIYRMMDRLLVRTGRMAYLMMCTILFTGQEGQKDQSGADILNERAKDIILRSVRRSDTVCEYGKGQYIILLINRTQESTYVVRDRIDHNLREAGITAAIEFAVSPVVTPSAYRMGQGGQSESQ